MLRSAVRTVISTWSRWEDFRVSRAAVRLLDDQPGLGPLSLVRRVFNVAVLTDGASYVKLGYRQPNSIEEEFGLSEALRGVYPAISPALPPWSLHFARGGVPFILSPKLHSIERLDTPKLAMKLLELFWQHGKAQRGSFLTPPSHRGLDIVGRWAPGLSEMLHGYMNRHVLRWGPAHGDFHAGNLLCDERGNPIVIDLDCVRLESPQILDWLYFNIEWAVANEGRHWVDVLDLYLDGVVPDAIGADTRGVDHRDPGVLLLYLLDRVGQEAKYGIRPNRAHVMRFVERTLSRIATVNHD